LWEIGSDDETLAVIGDVQFMSTNEPLFDDIYDYNVQYGDLAENTDNCMNEWLADTGSTHHISNWREIFSSYEPMPEVIIHGVGGKITQVAGQGTVFLSAQHGMRKHTLHLKM